MKTTTIELKLGQIWHDTRPKRKYPYKIVVKVDDNYGVALLRTCDRHGVHTKVGGSNWQWAFRLAEPHWKMISLPHLAVQPD